MKKATVMDDVQEIQDILEEYLGKRKAAKCAKELYAVAKRGERTVQAILNSYLEKDEVQECIEQLMTEGCKTEFETIRIPGSNSPIAVAIMKHKPVNNNEVKFIGNFKTAIRKSVKDFHVFVNDPSIVDPSIKYGKLQFLPGYEVATCYTYNGWEKLANVNGLRLGTKYEYFLFMGWLIIRLISEGWSEADAWNAVCTDSKDLGCYRNSGNFEKRSYELTGSREVAGKCDLANVYKILADDKKAGGFWIAGGCSFSYSHKSPLAHVSLRTSYDTADNFTVGWFVL